jgi:hypothetical protein
MTEEPPKLFISYSWSSPEHERWVLNLATDLRESGVDVILDKWDLKEGHDANAFMEKMVNDPTIKKVALICDQKYKEKADDRSGGVGTETQIISPEIYEREDQNKFVAIVTEKDDEGNPYRPIYYKSRIYIDMSEDNLYAENFEQLLRWIYDKPLHKKPELGKKPAFIEEKDSASLGTSVKFRRSIDAIRNNKEYCRGAISEYFDTFTNNLERFRLTHLEGKEFDDQVVENIEQFIPYRNEAIEIFLALAQYRNTPDTNQQIHRFIERLLPYMDAPPNIKSWNEADFDNFKFIVHEIFLYEIACLLKYECFDAVAYLLRQQYYPNRRDLPNMVGFSYIRKPIRALDYRNNRLNLRRLSLRADLLEQRSKSSGLAFLQLMQADFVLYIRDCLDILKELDFQSWWPETMVYIERHRGPFEIFARAQSKEYFDRIKCMFEIENKEDFEPLMEAFAQHKLDVPRWQFTSFNPAFLLNFDNLGKKP